MTTRTRGREDLLQENAELRHQVSELQQQIRRLSGAPVEPAQKGDQWPGERRAAAHLVDSARQSMHQDSQRLEILLEIDRSILTTRDPAATASNTLVHLADFIPGYLGSRVLLIDAASQELLVLACHGCQGIPDWGDVERLPMDQAAPGLESLKQGEVLNICRGQPGAEQFQSLLAGAQTFLAVPMLAGGSLIGILELISSTSEAFQTGQEQLAREIAISLAVAIEQARQFKAEQQRRQEAEIMRDVMATLASSVDLRQVLQVILLNLGKVVHYDRAALYMLQEDPQQASQPAPDPGEETPLVLSPEDPLVIALRRIRRPLIIPDIHDDRRFRHWPVRVLVHGWMGVPLFAGDEMLGVLSLGQLSPGGFNEADAQTAQLFTNQAADVLAKTRQYEEAHRRSTELELLTSFSLALRLAESQDSVLTTLMDQTTRVFGATSGTFLILERDESMLQVSFSQDKALVGEWHIRGSDLLWEVLYSGAPLFLSDVSPVIHKNPLRIYHLLLQGMASAILIPLHSPDSVFGLLVFTFQYRRDFSAEDQRLFSAITEIAGTALRRAAILETLEKQVATRTRHLSTLYEIGSASNEPIELALLLERVLSITLETMNSQRGAVMLIDESRRDRLALAAEHNLPEETRQQCASLSLHQAFWDSLARANEPVIIPDLAETSQAPGWLALAGGRALLGAPVRAKAQPLGILWMLSESTSDYTLEDITLFMTIADQIGGMVERARLYKRAERAAVAEERQRLARELHDSVSQLLYRLVLYAGAGRKVFKQGDLSLVEQYLERMDQTAQQALKEMRLLVYELRPSVFREEGLVGALNHRLRSVEKRTGINAHLVIEGQLSLDETYELALYRIIEEALNNTLKHAGATSVTIKMISSENQVDLTISDNGHGFKLEAAEQSGGLGLLGIRERVSNLGGSFSIQSEPELGTTLHIRLEVSK